MSEYFEEVNKTFRKTGAVGKNPLVYRFAEALCNKELLIADVGSGPEGFHAKRLCELGFKAIPFDCGKNVTGGVQDISTLNNFACKSVLLSNVLNVQPRKEDVKLILQQVKESCPQMELLICNLPKEPNKSGITESEVFDILEDLFQDVRYFKKEKVFVIKKYC